MSDDRIKEIEQKTEESKQQAIKEAKAEHDKDDHENNTIHTINPLTGTEVNITPEDLEGMEKKLEADTERD